MALVGAAEVRVHLCPNRNFSLLSFGEEAEEDEELVNKVSQVRAPQWCSEGLEV